MVDLIQGPEFGFEPEPDFGIHLLSDMVNIFGQCQYGDSVIFLLISWLNDFIFMLSCYVLSGVNSFLFASTSHKLL